MCPNHYTEATAPSWAISIEREEASRPVTKVTKRRMNDEQNRRSGHGRNVKRDEEQEERTYAD